MLSTPLSALGEQVLQASSQVWAHDHPLNPVHRLALVEQNQRGQRCVRGGGVRGLGSRQVARGGAGARVSAAAPAAGCRAEQGMRGSLGQPLPGPAMTAAGPLAHLQCGIGWLLWGTSPCQPAAPKRRAERNTLLAQAGAAPAAAACAPAGNAQPSERRLAAQPALALTNFTRLRMVGATSSRIWPIIWQGPHLGGAGGEGGAE